MSLEHRLWEWLPARADRRRLTDIQAAAAALDVPLLEVAACLLRMEVAGSAVRDYRVGWRSGWHRGRPVTPPASPDTPPTLW